ncbi:hypothetical protein [Nocardioides speluncae]|uniref:hypothetical protein n=1 Tax=Nocardioides speluncae TaxID=2670337 RepID=UPI00137B1BD2|nr:hypothetical protein [Nocardioides speluncae]
MALSFIFDSTQLGQAGLAVTAFAAVLTLMQDNARTRRIVRNERRRREDDDELSKRR